ncbi:MAG: ATP-binding protein [Bacteroidota bacterium]|nr:ATP-binding protein [Bacteroidota bacterium]
MAIKKIKEPKSKSDISFPQNELLDEQFMAMANAAPVLLWVADTNKECFFFNKFWLHFTGRTLEEETGNGWANGVHPNDMNRCMKIYTESFDKREEFKMEYRLLRSDGEYRWLLDNGIPHYSKDNIFTGYIGSCVDIHELKEVELRKDQFITAASHELKTPITSLSVYLHLIFEFLKNKHEDQFAGYADSAINQVNKITGLINQLLDLSRIQSSSLNFDWSHFSFCELVNSVVNKVQSTTKSHRININGSCKSTINGDQERLSQAIENLLNNAIKYSKGHDKIIVALSEDTKHVKLNVIDFGIGIDKDHLQKVFDRFYRIPGQREETFPGFGIGLFISQQIIKKHSGKIWAESIPDKETKFVFQIPIIKETA